jgi:hypothetical protein
MFCFCKFFCKSFSKVFCKIVKGKWIRFCEAFSRFEIFSPCFKCFSFDLTKPPLNEILLLVFKRVLRYQFWKFYCLPPFEHNMIPIRNLSIENHTNWKTLFKIRWWCSPFALGSYSLPLWHESPKTESLEPFVILSPSLVINKWVKIIPKTKSFCFELSPKRWRDARSDGEGWVTEWKPLSSPKTLNSFQYTYDLVWKYLKTH